MRSLLIVAASCLASAALAQYPGADQPPSDLKKGFDTISVRDAQRVLTYLATQCDGRGTGQPGYTKASEFIANEFKKLGLKPMGDNGTFFQTAPFTRWRFDPKTVVIQIDGKPVNFGTGELALGDGPADLNVSAKPVILKVTGDAASLGDTKFDGQLVFLEGNPNRAFARALTRSGAAGVIRVAPGKHIPTWRTAMGVTKPGGRNFVTGTISPAGEERILRAIETSKGQMSPLSGLELTSYTTPVQLTGTLLTEQVNVANVVAELPGSDPALSNEYVGIGGHLDHLGDVDGTVYPGADDDGSGSTAVVEIARAMVANPKKPRRSLIFMTFFGEEMGLLGSRYLTNHPPVPLDHMVAELQMDMVGRDSDGVQNGDQSRVDVAAENVDTIRLVGSKRISTELDREIQEQNKFIGFRFKYDAEDVYTRSDHYNFAAKGIPIAFLFDGFHPDYHRPTDTVDKIDWTKLTNAAKLYYLTAHQVADSDTAPVKDVKGNVSS